MPFAGYSDFDECVSKNSDKADAKAYCATIQRATEEYMTAPSLTQFRSSEVFPLQEAVSDFSVEEATGKMTAKVRIIKAGRSKNGRNYRASAIKEAVEKGLFNNVRMFVNHSTTPPLKRPMEQMVSAIESTEYDKQDEAMDGRVVFFNKEFYEYVQHAAPYMGDSINSLVRGTRTRDPKTGQVEEDIHAFVQPHSVDWVTFPAAGGEILAFESEGDGVEIDWTAITLEELKKNAPTIVTALQEEFKPFKKKGEEEDEEEKKKSRSKAKEGDEDESKKVIEDIVTARLTAHEKETQETQRKQSEAAKQVVEAFAKSGLPDISRARVMKAFEGITEYDEKAVTESITAAQEEIAALKVGPKITNMGPSGSTESGKGDTSFSVHESVKESFGWKPAKKESDDKKKE